MARNETIPLDGSPVGELSLSNGSYVITAKAQFDLPDDKSAARVDCELDVGTGTPADQASVLLNPGDTDILVLTAPVEVTSGGVVLNCSGAAVTASRVKLTAIQVDTLTVTTVP